ncbi:hypothetical protein [Protaetiibacter mangrovi]|uniref:Uncharacterized protein n=1 Tax=Protaetiibacter mangrovi TaxID=2970926 RepID=A0ABT1ZF76_9MICO|nr:hypothetical protein [Protaetiibacter mangrovi]MCS0499358.1 hypothetical protein [Protaetiibacter mangrovi]TPX02831.1 hypothetical protein FJ656_20355 [Schumannella luteola]
MIVIDYLCWVLALLVIAGGIVATVFAIRLARPRLALLALIPIGLGLLLAVFGVRLLPDPPAFAVVLALGVAGLGVLAGSPLTVYVLDLASREPVRRGVNGGILIHRERTGEEQEVLRGGATVGHLERAAIVGSIALGHPEVILAIIAIKGLGRFSELDSASARERFIIGTLASMLWAGACAVLAVLTVA